MTDVTVSKINESWTGDIKILTIELSDSPATGYTYDTLLDATDGKGAKFKQILTADFFKLGGSEAADTRPSWVAATGVVTLGTITTTPATGTLVITGK